MTRKNIITMVAMIMFSSPIFPTKYTNKLKERDSQEQILEDKKKADVNHQKSLIIGIATGIALNKAQVVILKSAEVIGNCFQKNEEKTEEGQNTNTESPDITEDLLNTDSPNGENLTGTDLLNLLDQEEWDTNTPTAASNLRLHKATPGGRVVRRD